MNYYSYNYNLDLHKRIKGAWYKSVFIDSLLLGAAMLFSLLFQSFVPIAVSFLNGGGLLGIYDLLKSPLFLTAVSGLSVLIPFGVVGMIKKVDVKYSYVPKKCGGLTAVGLFLTAMGTFMLANIITEIIVTYSYEFGSNIQAPSIEVGESVLDRAIYCYCFALLPAVFEEFGFRVVALQILRRYGDGFAIIVTSIMFALLHGNFQQIPFAFICGLILGYIAIRSGSVLISIAAHFGNNLTSTLMQVCGADYDTEHIIFFAILLIGAAAFIALLASKRFHIQSSPRLPVNRAGLGAIFFASPTMLLSTVVLLWMAFALLS